MNNQAEVKIKQYVIDYVKDRNLIEKDDNIYFAEKAFKVGSILRWCVRRKHNGFLSDSLAEKYFKWINLYINDIAEIEWKDGRLRILGNKAKGKQ